MPANRLSGIPAWWSVGPRNQEKGSRETDVKLKFTTRLEDDLQRRLRIFAAYKGRKVEDVVHAAIDGYLLSADADADAAARDMPRPTTSESGSGAGTPEPQTV